MCKVPSGQENSRVYDICSDIGTCTCAAGQQDAFSKHQALVHHHYGGPFPNAPVLTFRIARANKRVPAGHPSKGLPAKRAKKEHNLSMNIKKDVPNAKSHGIGH
ncbi:hypothetical protein IscW_ISCW002724 [Ixodes scapularis]|uniref:Uncharacterized protein n=1 Tax=Ixodes scapularis TaxID=6945 RepID=B7PDA8_IXOSC|nr:hypothetical protein IscW_ISCW002724 [Ixodes scapularis]|eukprot:XP_002410708.1 hypothetical protein IscW_ISCW002724 [Ixodes scapularis]